jgi:membrane protease YdiL (CAAX protease family)
VSATARELIAVTVSPARVARDPPFAIAAAAGPAVWLAFAVAFGLRPDPAWFFFSDPAGFFGSAVAWPLAAEGLFRGLVQPALARARGGARAAWGVTTANAATSLLVAAAYLLAQGPAWAAAAFASSLVLGCFRDRYDSIVPGAALHVYYGCGWFLTVGP